MQSRILKLKLGREQSRVLVKALKGGQHDWSADEMPVFVAVTKYVEAGYIFTYGEQEGEQK